MLTTGGKRDPCKASILASIQAGFTLVELLVVLAILVMIALAVPTLYSRTHQAMVLKTTTATLVQSLRTLRQQALSQGRVHQWAVAPGAHGYQLDAQSTIPLASDKVHLRFEPLSASGKNSSNLNVSEAPTSIRFFPDGSATGGRLFVATDQRTRVILIDWLTGRVHLDD